jgi:hypothetical protein
MEEVRIVTQRFGTGEQKTVLELGTNPKFSRRTCTCEYGLQACRGESAGVAKPPRERAISHPKPLVPLRFAAFCIAVRRRTDWNGGRATAAAAPASTNCVVYVRFCRYRFKFQSNLVWDSIKPISNFRFQLARKCQN